MFFFVPLRKILYPHQAIMCFCNLAFCDMKVKINHEKSHLLLIGMLVLFLLSACETPKQKMSGSYVLASTCTLVYSDGSKVAGDSKGYTEAIVFERGNKMYMQTCWWGLPVFEDATLPDPVIVCKPQTNNTVINPPATDDTRYLLEFGYVRTIHGGILYLPYPIEVSYVQNKGLHFYDSDYFQVSVWDWNGESGSESYDYNMEAKFKYGLFPSIKEDTWKVTLELEKISTEEYPDKPLIVKVEYDIQVGKVSYPLLVSY